MRKILTVVCEEGESRSCLIGSPLLLGKGFLSAIHVEIHSTTKFGYGQVHRPYCVVIQAEHVAVCIARYALRSTIKLRTL